MSHKTRPILLLLLLACASIPLFAEADHIRIRTTVGMEPYGHMETRHWGAGGNEVKGWDITYGFTPGLEFFVNIGDIVGVGAGFKYQVKRKVIRSGGDTDEFFNFIPLYAAARFKLMTVGKLDMHAVIRIGYGFFTDSPGFQQIWTDEGDPLNSSTGGIYAAASLGVTIPIVSRSGWGLDYSMDAGYAFHQASAYASSGKTYPIAYQAMAIDFALDWRF